MFRFFKKDKSIYAPITGTCMDISACKDETFASKLLGDGFFILPDANVVKAPCDGRINTIFPTKHAITMTSTDGKELLIHIGIDTVKLNGLYFESFVEAGETLKKGTPLMKFDEAYMREHDIDMSTLVILLNRSTYSYKKLHLGKQVVVGTKIVDFEGGE